MRQFDLISGSLIIKVALISFDGQFPTQLSLSVFISPLIGFLAVHGSDLWVCFLHVCMSVVNLAGVPKGC